MAINTSQNMFGADIQTMLDAEHRFVKGMEEMLQKATAPQVQQILNVHIQQTQHQIQNLQQVCSLLGIQAQRGHCHAAEGLVDDAKHMMDETSNNPALLNLAIGAAGDKIEHFEIGAYTPLIATAQSMQQPQIVQLLQQNLQQEQETAQKIEQSTPTLLQQLGSQQFTQGSQGTQSGLNPL